MRNWFENFLTGGHTFAEDQYELKLKFILFNTLIFFHSLAAIWGMSYRFIHHNYLYFAINFFFMIFVLIAVWMSRRSKEAIKPLTWIVLFLGFPVVTLYFYNNLNPISSTSWFTLLLFISYAFKGYRVSIIVFFLSLAIIFYIGFFYRGYTLTNISLGLIPYGAIVMFIYAFQKSYIKLTQAVHEEKQRYEHLAHHDLLTGIPNRSALKEYFKANLNHKITPSDMLVVLFLDLDHFKEINDHHGHAVGDHVLNIIAKRLQSQTRESDFLARHGGDEFLIVMNHVETGESILRILDHILFSLCKPIHYQENVFHLSASIGIAIAPQDGHQYDALIRYADQAMYYTKRTGGNGFSFYHNISSSQGQSDKADFPERS